MLPPPLPATPAPRPGAASSGSRGRADPDLGRIATVPNAITLARLGVLAAALGLLFGEGQRVSATVLLAVAGATDFLDGYVARRFGQVSTLGKVIDPVADRIVLASGAVAIVVYGALPVWLGAIVLGREAAISVATLVLAALGARRLDVVWFGKAGTFGMMVALPLFLLGDGPGVAAEVVRAAAWICVVPAELLLLGAGASYVPAARKALEEGRALRRTQARLGTDAPHGGGAGR